MCYSYRPVFGPDGDFYRVSLKEFNRLWIDGKITANEVGEFHYAKSMVPALVRREDGYRAESMRWDLLPRNYLFREQFTLEETLRKKNSRAKNPETGKAWGFSSFNARVETIATLPSFKKPWAEGLRCVLATNAYKERPNRDDAPPSFKNREYDLNLDAIYFLAGIYDTWTSKTGEVLPSCTIITTSSQGHAVMESIWHERIPVLLNAEQAEEWLDAKTEPKRAWEMCRQLGAGHITAVEVSPPRLDLF